jgi:hypothetical protein
MANPRTLIEDNQASQEIFSKTSFPFLVIQDQT